MSKRGGFPGGMNFGGMNINQLMKEAKKMQADMEKSQEELQAKDFEATAGGGAARGSGLPTGWPPPRGLSWPAAACPGDGALLPHSCCLRIRTLP